MTALQRKPGPVNEVPEPIACSSEGFIDLKQYELPPVPRSDDPAEQDKLFDQWRARALVKYPQLLFAYSTLRECWDHYHPVKK